MSALNRRNFLKASAGTTLLGLTPWRGTLGQTAVAPHFFLEVHVLYGWDASYLFDGRPMSMTSAGKIQNYVGLDPNLWTGANGQTALASTLAEPLKPYFDRFSILNGVHMAQGFDGHEQNRNYALTGNPFGGEMLLPQLNAAMAERASLDYVQVGTLDGTEFSNTGGGVILDPDTARAFAAGITAPGPAEDPVAPYLMQRLIAAGAATPESGLFAEGASLMVKGLAASQDFAKRMFGITFSEDSSELTQSLSMAHQYFKRRIAQSALIVLEHPLDTHDAASAKNQPEIYKSVVGDLAEIFRYLSETQFDDQEGVKLIDVTTVVITSEFGRTMRQEGAAIDNTGTDHNPQCNTVLLAGKGIKKGLIIGESDNRTPTEVLSPAHLSIDSSGVRAMGRPFDPATLKVRVDLDPASIMTYEPVDYLSYSMVANTIFKLFNVDASLHWKIQRNGANSPILSGLLES